MKIRILDRATKLFFRYGVKSVTMDTIASDLGISKKTIYLHYPDKDTLVNEVVTSFIEKDTCQWKELNQKYPDVIEKMFKSFEIMKEMLVELNPALMFEIQKYHPASFQIFEQHKKDVMYSYLVSDLNSGISDGYFRPELSVEMIAKLRMAEVHLIFDPEFFENSTKSVYDMQLDALDYFMRGIMTEKGLKVYNSYLNKTNK